MARDIFTNGETMVYVKASQNASVIAALSELGLTDGPVRITFNYNHMDVNANAWGDRMGPPIDVQTMLIDARISMTFVHYDPSILTDCWNLSRGRTAASADPFDVDGVMARAGIRLGNGVGRFVTGNFFIGLNLASPVGGIPWRFYFAYMTGPPVEIPLGVERSLVTTNWRAVPYPPNGDPWNSGAGARGVVMYDHILDT